MNKELNYWRWELGWMSNRFICVPAFKYMHTFRGRH